MKISHGDQSLRIFKAIQWFNVSQICSDYSRLYWIFKILIESFAWKFLSFAKQIQVVPLSTVGFAPLCLFCPCFFPSGLPLRWIGVAWNFATLAWRLSFRRSLDVAACHWNLLCNKPWVFLGSMALAILLAKPEVSFFWRQEFYNFPRKTSCGIPWKSIFWQFALDGVWEASAVMKNHWSSWNKWCKISSTLS